jgi:hypothetical protein
MLGLFRSVANLLSLNEQGWHISFKHLRTGGLTIVAVRKYICIVCR